MEAEDFKRWRRSLGLSQKDAAEQLGLKRRVVQYYEKGERDGEEVKIPKTVRLACFALTQDVKDYHGPSPETEIPEMDSAEDEEDDTPKVDKLRGRDIEKIRKGGKK